MAKFPHLLFKAVSQNYDKLPLPSTYLFPSTWNNSASPGYIFVKFYIWVFFENFSKKLEFHYHRTRIMGTLHEDSCTFMIISRSVLLKMRNVSDKICRKGNSTHFTFSNFLNKNRTVCEIMWKNIVERGRSQMAIWCMHIACWIPKATNTNTHVV
jgi:hypothetical protein